MDLQVGGGGGGGHRKSKKKTRQKNTSGDSKVESNDSPEISDRVIETPDIHGLPLGMVLQPNRRVLSPCTVRKFFFKPIPKNKNKSKGGKKIKFSEVKELDQWIVAFFSVCPYNTLHLLVGNKAQTN